MSESGRSVGVKMDGHYGQCGRFKLVFGKKLPSGQF